MNDQPTSARLKVILPIIIVFIFVNVIAVVFPALLEKLHIQQTLIVVGNLILFGVTMLSFLLYQKAMMAGKTSLFIRNVYSGMLIKFFVCLVAAFLYIYNARESVNKAGVFVLMFLYLVYTFLEVFILMKQSKQSNNA
jgi:hypothetical protein